MQSDSGIILNSIRDFFYVIFKHKGKIVLAFLAILALATAITFALPQVYESEASLLVRIGRENYPDDPSLEGTMVNLTQDRTAEVKSEVAILQSALLAEMVVDELGEGWILDDQSLPWNDVPGLEWQDPTLIKQVTRQLRGLADQMLLTLRLIEPMTPREKAVKAIRDGLLVDAERQTNIINARFESGDPKLAQAILDRLIGHYMDRHVDIFATRVTPDFFADRASNLEIELNATEASIDQFRREFGVSDLTHQKETLINQISTLEGEVSDSTAEADALEAKVKRLEAELSSRSRMHEVARTTGLPNNPRETIKDRLIDLKLQESDLSGRYPDSHRPLIEVREQIRKMETVLADEEPFRTEVTTQLDRNYEGIEHTYLMEKANLEGFRARIAKLEEKIGQHREELARLAGLETELRRLERRYDVAESEYRTYRDNLRQANITAAMTVDRVSNVRIVQPASAPLSPSRPNKLRNVALGLLLGLFGGLALAFLIEFFDDTLNTTEAVEKRLKLPVLTSLSDKEYKACT